MNPASAQTSPVTNRRLGVRRSRAVAWRGRWVTRCHHESPRRGPSSRCSGTAVPPPEFCWTSRLTTLPPDPRRFDLPESRTRKAAERKKKAAQARKVAERQEANESRRAVTSSTSAKAKSSSARSTSRSGSTKSASARSSTAKSSSARSGTAKDTEPIEKLSTAERRRRSREAAEAAETADDKGTKAKSSAAKADTKSRTDDKRPARTRSAATPANRRWVPPTFIAVGLLGVMWLIVYYIAPTLPVMGDLGNWNILIGMGLMGLAFAIATLWK
ncbi:cell division protein CrgA [Microlunatus sp. Y2014]|uniref:cell division protein CrgA n=1 Tax=Microlunatus sp. Y2014 TaxID=3418488 RepID=UPI003DA74DC3